MSDINDMLNELNSLDETYFLKDKLDDHYNKHVAKDLLSYFVDNTDELFDPITKEEYNEAANELSKQPVFSSDINSSYNIVGFVTKKNAIVKYNKISKEIVIYVANKYFSATLTYYKVSDDRRYLNLLKRDYFREISPEDDFYNK